MRHLRTHGSAHVTTSPHTGIKSPVFGPWFVLALAGARRLVVQTKAVEKADLIHSDFFRAGGEALVDAYRGTCPIRKRPTPLDPPTTLGIGLH